MQQKPSLRECPVCEGRGDVPSRLPFRRKVCPECGGTGHVTPTRREQLLKRGTGDERYPMHLGVGCVSIRARPRRSHYLSRRSSRSGRGSDPGASGRLRHTPRAGSDAGDAKRLADLLAEYVGKLGVGFWR
jgi:hypothetical protein